MERVIRNVRLRGSAERMDTGIAGGLIAEIAPAGSGAPGDGARGLDAEGRLVLPGFADAHMHLDKCMSGDVMRPNRSQTLDEAIEITSEHKRSYDHVAPRCYVLHAGNVVVRTGRRRFGRSASESPYTGREVSS